jgi:hypothetical protein
VHASQSNVVFSEGEPSAAALAQPGAEGFSQEEDGGKVCGGDFAWSASRIISYPGLSQLRHETKLSSEFS